MRQISEAPSLADAMAWSMRAKRVTYRQYGLHGELRRPMIHRFEVPGGVSTMYLMAENIMCENLLLKALMRKGHGDERGSTQNSLP